MTTISPSNETFASILNFVGIEDYNELLAGGKSNTALGRVDYVLWSLLNDFQDADKSYSRELNLLSNRVVDEQTNIQRGFTADATWILQAAESAQSYAKTMSKLVKEIKDATILRNLMLEGK